MNEKIEKAVCNQCNHHLEEIYNLPLEKRKPCPKCESFNRKLQVKLSDTVEVHGLVKLRHKMAGRSRAISEIVSGDDFNRDKGIWLNLSRVIDRTKNWYKEKITNPNNGEITHYTSHPLDQHIGHGSDKLRKD